VHYAIVYFATGRSSIPRWKYRQVSRLIRVMTVSPICHCMIGFEGAVLDPSLGGIRYWPSRLVAARYPTLHSVFRVPFRYRIDLDFFNELVGQPQPILPSLARWLKLGHGPWVYDCLCVSLACLRAGGVDVNPHIATPAGLYRWLKKKGFAYDVRNGQAESDFRVAVRRLCIG